ncbi:MAG: hypothetical protein AWU57_306 [Marinobacter sp. T13-3]|nr:MAG: hypothetical protein AWU57_306 [Marinobacter sp. T13-3]
MTATKSTKASKTLFTIDKCLEERLTALANVGVGFKPAAEQSGSSTRTIIRAAARQKKLDWLCKLFPASEKTIRREANADKIPAMQMRALSMSWRAPNAGQGASAT